MAAGAARAVLDLSISPSSGFSVTIKTDNLILAGFATVGALSLGAFYVANRSRVENAVRNGLENRNEAGVIDPEVRNIEESSILVELYCHSVRSFLQFVEDVEAQKVKHRLEEEFAKIGFQQKLMVTIINDDEVYKKVKEIRLLGDIPLQERSITEKVGKEKGTQKVGEHVSSQSSRQKRTESGKAAIPVCLPNNCKWDETSGNLQRDRNQPRRGLQLVNAGLRKLRAIQGPVCVVSIAGPCRRGKSYILSRAFDQGAVFPVGHSFDPETMGIWMWVVPDKYTDDHGQEFTVVLLDSEGTDAVGAEGINDHAILTLSVLFSSVLIYNSVGVPTRTDLEGLDHIIKTVSQRIQVIAGQPLDDEDSLKVFPSFVWLLRDVVLRLPKGVENLNKYFLEKVFKAHGRPTDKSQKVVNNILNFFPVFDAFPLSPPSSDEEVLLNLTEEGRQAEINSSFLKGIEDFKQMLRTKLSPKRGFGGGVVTGEALAALMEEYVKAVNSPGAVPVVQSTWDVTKKKCTQALNDAKAVYERGMKVFRERVRLPCDDREICSSHEDHLLEALTFFESKAEDTSVTARWLYMEKLANFADEAESALLRENNNLTKEQCSDLMKTLRMVWLEPVLRDLQDADNTDFLVLEERLRSVYHKLDCDFRQQAPGSKSLCSSLAYIYELQHFEEMKEHLAQLKTRRLYFEQIASDRAARGAEAEETEKIRLENVHLAESRKDIEDKIAQLEEKHIAEERKLKRMVEQQMRTQREQTEAAMLAARERSAAEREKYLRQQRELQAQIETARRKQQEQEETINSLRDRLRRM